MVDEIKRKPRFFWPAFVLAAALSLVLVVAGGLIYRIEKQNALQSVRNELSFIADLKVRQITEWRQERLSDATGAAQNELYTDLVARLLEGSATPEEKIKVQDWIKILSASNRYEKVLLLDSEGRVRMSSAAGEPSTHSPAHDDIKETLRDCRPLLSTFHREKDREAIHLDLYAPLVSPSSSNTEKSCPAALWFIIDPKNYLYPLIQSWPTPSETAESLLVRRDGDDVVFINELRHRKNTALNLRIPVADAKLPAAMAVRGKEGVVEGIDYRGVPVLAALRGVPDSPWFLVAKVDLDEVYGLFRIWARPAAMALGSLLLVVALAFGYWWNRRESRFYRHLHEAERRRQALVQHFNYMMRYANDAIILANDNKEIVEVNERACDLYGYTREKFVGMPMNRIRPPEGRADLDKKLKQSETVSGAVYETVHQREDGGLFPVEVSLRAFLLEGRFFYQAIIRDISERKRAEEDLRRSEEGQRKAQSVARLGNWIWHVKTNRLELSDELYRIFGIEKEDFTFSAPDVIDQAIHPDDRERVEAASQSVLRDGKRTSMEYRIVWPDGSIRTVWAEAGELVLDPDGTPAVLTGIIQDITDRKQTENALRESEEIFSRFMEYSPIYVFFKDENIRALRLSKNYETMLGKPVEELLGKSMDDLFPSELAKSMVEDDQRILKGGKEITVEEELDGRFYSTTKFPIMIEGKPRYLAGYTMDITERKQAEEALREQSAWLKSANERLRESEQLARTLLNATNDIAHLIDEDGTIIDLNDAMADALGSTREKLIGTCVFDRFEKEEAERKKGIAREVIREQKPIRFIDEGLGPDRIFDSSIYPIATAGGEKRQIVVFAHDITARKKAEESLRESEERFRRVFEESRLGMLMSGADFHFFQTNDAFCRMIGYTEQELHALTFKDITHPDHIQQDAESVMKVFRGEIPYYRTEKRYIRKGGDVIWGSAAVSSIRDYEGNFLYFLVMVEDITAQKRAEAEIKLNEARLEGLLRISQFEGSSVQEFLDFSLHEAIDLTGSKIGIIFFYDEEKQALTLNTWSSEVMTECAVRDPFTVHQLDETGLWGEAIRQRKPIVINDYRTPHSGKKGYPEGHVHLEKFLTIPVFHDRRIVAVVGVANKETDYEAADVRQLTLLMDSVWKHVDRLHAEKALQESEEKHRILLEESPDPIFSLAQEGRYLYVNQAFAEGTGVPAREIIGKKIWDVFPQEEADKSFTILLYVFRTGIERVVEARGPKLHSDRTYLTTITPIKDAKGNVFSVICSSKDITARKTAEVSLRESEEKYRLLAENVSDVIWTMDLNFRYTYCSPSVMRMRGFTVEEAMAQSLDETLTPSSAETAKKAFAEEWAQEQKGQYTPHKEHTLELEQTCKDGSTIWTEVKMSFLRDEKGKAVGILGVTRDITERRRTEEALRESEQKFVLLFRNSLYAIVISRPEAGGRIVEVNDAFAALLGYSREEALQASMVSLGIVSQDVRDRANNDLLSGKPVSGWEVIFKKKSGNLLTVLASVQFLVLNNEKYVVTSFIDITERKRAEEALSKSKKQLSNAIEIAHLGPWEYDVAADLFTFNDYFYGIFRTTAEQAGGYTMSSAEYARRFVHPDDGPLVGQEVQKAIETTDPNFNRQIEHRILYADGTIGHMVVRIFIIKDVQGRTITTYGVNQDITERKRAEEALRESDARYRMLFEASHDALMTLGPPSWNFLSCNQATVELFRLEDEAEITSLSPLTLSPEKQPDGRDSAEKAGSMIEKAMREGSHFFEWTHRRTDGETFPAEVLLTRMEQGSQAFLHATVRDITERIRAEEEKLLLEAQLRQQQKLESIGTLASGVAHEINNPLTGILNFAELIQARTPKEDKRYDFAGKIVVESERVAAIVRNLLSFARQEKERHSPAPIGDIIRSALMLLEGVLRKDQVQIAVDIEEGLPKIKCRSQQIQQVLVNLIANARDALNERYPGYDPNKTISIKAFEVPKSGRRWVRTVVEDHGTGIAESKIARIFDPFFTTKPTGVGTGLGLSVSHGIVRDHQGDLTVQSQAGEFTTFYLDLPVDDGGRLKEK